MSRKVLINRLAEAMNCKAEEIPNVNELTNSQLYWILQHEKLHKRFCPEHNLIKQKEDLAINPVLAGK